VRWRRLFTDMCTLQFEILCQSLPTLAMKHSFASIELLQHNGT
jgi:hypothetical protein